MTNYNLNSDEFDYIIELIAAVMFMAIGVVGIVFMVNQFNRQVQATPRVDKVRVSSIDQEDKDPFYFTAYQSYMFSYMMDGHDKTALYWFGDTIRENGSTTVGGDGNGSIDEGDFQPNRFPMDGRFIGLVPAEMANGFIVVRNRAIIGSGEYGGSSGSTKGNSVKRTIYTANGFDSNSYVDGWENGNDVGPDYRGEYGKLWHLTFTDAFVNYEVEEYADEGQLNLFERRKDYVWSLYRVNPNSP